MWLLRKFCPFLFIVSFHHWQVSHLLSSWYSRLSFRRPRHSSTWKQPFQRYSELPSSLRCCDKSVAIWDEPGVSIFPHASRWTNTFCTRWVCQTFSFGRSLGGFFCSNFSSYHLIWSSFVRAFGVFPDSIDKRLLYYKQAVFLLRVLSVRVLFMCFRGRFKGFRLTYLLSADQQWLSFQMSLSGFLPPS